MTPVTKSAIPETEVISSCQGPATPRFATKASRIESFRHWPQAMTQRPAELAEAGFIYQGMGDHVQCFYCDGGLKNWDPIDVPWAEHARWFGNCAYLRLKLGKIFVDWVKNVNYLDQRAVEQKIKEIENRQAQERAACTVASREADNRHLNLEHLQDENHKLRERRMCKVGHGAAISVVFKPCFHMSACGNCAIKMNHCPVCEKEIQERKTIFL